MGSRDTTHKHNNSRSLPKSHTPITPKYSKVKPIPNRTFIYSMTNSLINIKNTQGSHTLLIVSEPRMNNNKQLRRQSGERKHLSFDPRQRGDNQLSKGGKELSNHIFNHNKRERKRTLVDYKGCSILELTVIHLCQGLTLDLTNYKY